MGMHTIVHDPQSITGLRYKLVERADYGIKIYRFRAFLEPTITDWSYLLPVMGFPNTSGNNYTMGSEIEPFDVLVEYGDIRCWRWENSFCDVVVVRDAKGSVPQQVEMQFVALDENYNYNLSDHDSTFPVFPSPQDAGFIFTQSAMTLRGTSREFDQYSLIINNNLVPRWQNSQTADAVCTGGAEIYLATSTPYNATNRDLYEEPASNTAFEAGSLVYTRGGRSLAVNMHRLVDIARPPSIKGKNIEVRLPNFYEVMGNTTTPPVAFVLDNTP